MKKIMISVAPVAATDILINPRAIARDVYQCYKNGAAMVHLHCRDLNGRLTPDLSLLEPLAAALGVSVAELLSGEQITNQNRSANPMRGKFYVCPVCGNVMYAMGEGAFSCCGVALPPLEAEEADGEHAIHVEEWEGRSFVTLDHPMEKDHYLSFLAQVRFDRVELVKLYPEQLPEATMSHWPGATFYVYCNRHGLYQVKEEKG